MDDLGVHRKDTVSASFHKPNIFKETFTYLFVYSDILNPIPPGGGPYGPPK